MFGNKLWSGKKDLLKFAKEKCYLSQSEALKQYEECIEALKSSINELELYIEKNGEFKDIGSKMLDIWRLSVDENRYKEVPDAIIRNWSKD